MSLPDLPSFLRGQSSTAKLRAAIHTHTHIFLFHQQDPRVSRSLTKKHPNTINIYMSQSNKLSHLSFPHPSFSLKLHGDVILLPRHLVQHPLQVRHFPIEGHLRVRCYRPAPWLLVVNKLPQEWDDTTWQIKTLVLAMIILLEVYK